MLFSNFHAWFFRHKEFSKWFGIRFERSDEWKTSRKETNISGFEFPLLRFFGIRIEVGNLNFDKIKELKEKLSEKSDVEIDFLPYFKKGETLNWQDFEVKMADVFYGEIFRVFDVTPPKDKNQFINAIVALRRSLSTGGLYGKWLMVKNFLTILPLATYFKSLTYTEQIIAIAPFMTVLDFAMFNIRDQSKNLQINERLQVLSKSLDLKYIPMVSNGEMIFCEVFVNKENNFGNSMFGPRGLRCPGGVFTKMFTDAFTNFMNKVDYKVKRISKTNGKEEVVLSF